MKFLRLKKHRVRKDGIRSILPVVIEKARRYGRVEQEQKLSVRRDILVTGAYGAGKTRWLLRMAEQATAIWRGRQAIVIRCVHPLSSWIERDEVREYAVRRYEKSWTALRAWQRAEALIEWVSETSPVVMFDDAHLLTGRKLETARRMLDAAQIVVVTCIDEQRLPITFRMALAQRNPQRVSLKSDAAFDVTQWVVWLVVITCIAAGAWEIGAAAAGLNMLGRGKRAARQS